MSLCRKAMPLLLTTSLHSPVVLGMLCGHKMCCKIMQEHKGKMTFTDFYSSARWQENITTSSKTIQSEEKVESLSM